MDTKNFIGMDQYGGYVFQEVEDGIIKGFNSACVEDMVDGSQCFNFNSWTHKVEINGVKLESGVPALPSIELPDDVADLYSADIVTCDSCCVNHYRDDHGKSWTFVCEYWAVCLSCRTAETALVELVEPESVFKAKNLKDVNLDGYAEITTLFCDSSGFGAPGERAMTKSQTLERVREIMQDHDAPLYAGITDMGQFQVYVTIFVKK